VRSEHGGNIWPMIYSGRNLNSVIDFSSNLNNFIDPGDIGRTGGTEYLRIYPEDQPEWLLEKLSRYSHARSEEILLGPGLTHFIHLIGDLYENSKLLIASPTFTEYERTCNINDIRCTVLPDRILSTNPHILDRFSPSAVILTRPDNPTGSMITLPDLRGIIETAERIGSMVFVDEAFIDFTGDREFFTTVPLVNDFSNLVLGRSLTKILAMPSIRMGYLVSKRANLDAFERIMEPWAIGQDHLEIMRDTDLEGIRKSTDLVKESREYLIGSMKKIGMEKVGEPHANFVTFRIMEGIDPDKLLSSLESSGILVRSLWNYRDFGRQYIRISVKPKHLTDMLLEALRKAI